jgi:hypothetical protein
MVKRYEPKCSCGQGDIMRPINDATEDADQYVSASDYDAQDLELSQAYSERQREHELRVRIAGDAEALVADHADNVRRMADDANKLHSAYARIRELNDALKDMVNAWEPDGDGSDRRMWQRAKDLLWTQSTSEVSHD